MIRKISLILAAMTAQILTGCRSLQHPDDCPETGTVTGIMIKAGLRGSFETRSAIPDEERISDLNVFLFNSSGDLEESIFTDRTSPGDDCDAVVHSSWITGTECRVAVCANFGFRINGIRTLGDLRNMRYYMAYPDEYSRGIPMAGDSGLIMITGEDNSVRVDLKRMMAKVTLTVDRTGLDKGISFNVRSVQAAGTPRSVAIFGGSRAEGSQDVFTKGFLCSGTEADQLNIEVSPGRSREASLYVLENMQGNLLPDAVSEKDKIPDLSDAMSSLCSYIEIKAEYQSGTYYTPPDEYLIYRFYLGDSPQNFDVERNCEYRITIRPEGDGISEDSWRVDKSSLDRIGPATLTVYPGNYVQGYVGDEIHIRASVIPEDARIEFGKEELEYDRERGIYDYVMDSDGKGVVLHLAGKGSGLVYVEAGTPVSDAAGITVVVN
ncbi:MAG: hypothetical protein ACI3ZC_06605 [Candidatus Cryptobacteroides sp.]